MRKLPTILAFAFIVITLFRVAQFAGERMYAGLLGWVFSVALGAGVYLFSYYTRDNITRQDGKEDKRDTNVKTWAWVALVFFMLVDAAFNCLEVWLSVNPATDEMKVATGLYGAFPTVAAALLGALQGHIDRLPVAPTKATTNIVVALKRAVVAKVDAWGETQEKQPAQQEKQEATPMETPEKQSETITGKERVLTLHREYPSFSSAQLAQQAGVTPQYVRKLLSNNGHNH